MAEVYKDFITGLTVLSKYEAYGNMGKSPDGYEILAGETNPLAMSEDDCFTMNSAGWTWNDKYECWAHNID